MGSIGANDTSICGSLAEAVKQYYKVYRQKCSTAKGYVPIAMKMGKTETSVSVKMAKTDESSGTSYEKSKLHAKV